MNLNTVVGGVEILPYAGPSTETIDRLSGRTLSRLVTGKGVPMVHWKKYAGSISGTGWTPPGVDNIPVDVPVELWSIKVMSANSSSSSVTVDTEVRPDKDPWVEAYTKSTDRWVRGEAVASTTVNAQGKTVTTISSSSVSGDVYRFNWCPKFTVFVLSIGDSQDTFTQEWQWNIEWEEL